VQIAAKEAAATAASRTAKRGKPPTLTEEQIVDAALDIIRAEGLDALSMRRLSRELGRSAMAPYWYVSDKRELLDLVARKPLSEVVLPEPDSGPWEERLRAVVTGIDARLHAHPGVATVLLERMRSTDRRLMNGILEILQSAGFEGPNIFLSYAMIHTYLFGRYQVVELDTPDPSDVDPGDLEDTLAKLVPHLEGLHGRDFFNYGVDTIIEGLRAQLAAKKSKTSKKSGRR
jgi:TetR/AcrR family transcriptional regulator, tetracycline repressor protein